jgi:hypothetical protein
MPAKTIPSPFEAPELWETLVITDGRTKYVSVTGVVDVDIVGRGLKEREATVPGRDGSTYTFLGYRDAEADIRINVLDKSEFANLREVIEKFRNRKGQAPIGYEFIHPNLQLHDINYLYIFNVTAADYNPDTGYTLTLECREWQASYKTRTQSTSKTNNKPKPTPKPTKPKDDGIAKGGSLPPSKTNKPQKPQSSAAAARNDRPSTRLMQNPLIQKVAAGAKLGVRVARGQ